MEENAPSFNKQQLNYLHDTSFLLEKRKISRELQQLLATTERALVKLVNEEKPAVIPEDCLIAAGKISRGENYRGLPYLVLDYPRLLKQDDIFTFRTMFWWGNFFSCTLHLQGISLDRYRENIRSSLFSAKEEYLRSGTFLCVNKSPWEYHYGKDNYLPLSDFDNEALSAVLDKDFIKVSQRMELKDYRNLEDFAISSFRRFLSFAEKKES